MNIDTLPNPLFAFFLLKNNKMKNVRKKKKMKKNRKKKKNEKK